MVSHDLRTLLGGIAMSAALLLRQPAEGEAGERTHLEARRTRRFTARMNRLIGDLLDVVSIASGKLTVVPERHDATRLLNETTEAGGDIALRIEPIGAGVRFTVRDSGPGISAEPVDAIGRIQAQKW